MSRDNKPLHTKVFYGHYVLTLLSHTSIYSFRTDNPLSNGGHREELLGLKS